jgi:antirestriction protein ArdC
MLIWLQRPNATAVAGYRKWQELGYQVAKGEHGISILAPVIVKRPGTDDEGRPKEVERCVGFKEVKVFDASQLTEKVTELDLMHDIPDDADEQRHMVSRAFQQAGVVIMEDKLPGGTMGLATYKQLDPHAALSPVIILQQGLNSRQATSTLIHERAHLAIHFDPAIGKVSQEARELPLNVREAQVEAVAYIVSKYVGVEPPMSADYILHYQNTAQTLVDNMHVIHSVSRQIISELEGAMKD